MSTQINVATVTRAELSAAPAPALLSLFNSVTGKSTSKFASREKGIEQTWKAVQAARKTNGGAKPEAKPVPQETAKPEAKPVKAKTVRKPKDVFNAKVDAGGIQPHRPGTKRASVIEMLSRPAGATIEEVMAAVEWDRKTAYDGIRLLNTYLGYGLRTSEAGRIHLVKP